MKRLAPALALAIAGCAWPDTYFVSGGYGQGTFDPDNTERTTYDTDEWVGMVGIGWSPGSWRQHRESLEATRRVEIATVTGKFSPVVVNNNKGDEEVKEQSAIESALTGIPKTEEEGRRLLMWAFVIVLISLAALIFKYAGVLEKIPFFRQKKDPK